MLVDTHCHLYKEYYDEIEAIIKKAEDNGVNRVIVSGCDNQSNEEVVNLCQKYDNVYGTLGIHPENVLTYKKEDFDYIQKHLGNPRIVAVGEIGLDYHYSKDNKDEQIELFEKQLKIAEDLNIPVVIHSREATLDTIETLKKYNVKGVIHSFSGSLETAKEYIKMGYLLGVNGVITFKNANLKDVIREIPLENILLETDSPFLTPVPFRGKQNDPSHILDIAKFVCELKNITLEELQEIENKNIKNIFGI